MATRTRVAPRRRPVRPSRPGGRTLLVRLGIVWFALADVAAVAGVYSQRVLHSTFAVDAAIVGGVCSGVVAAIAFASASGRRP